VNHPLLTVAIDNRAMATSFDSFGSSAFPMAWSPQQSAGAGWPGQTGPAAFEPERASTGINLLAQLGLVPSQAMPARGVSGSQTLLSTTVAPQRSHADQMSHAESTLPAQLGEIPSYQMSQRSQAEQMSLGSLEPSNAFSYSPPSQRYQAFSPARDMQDMHGGDTEWANTTPGSAGKNPFRFNPNASSFNPHAVPFVPSTGADRLSDHGPTDAAARASLFSGEDKELRVGEAEAVSAAVASSVISSPPSGPCPAPPAGHFLAASTTTSVPGHAPPPRPPPPKPLLTTSPVSEDSAESRWLTEEPEATEVAPSPWLPATISTSEEVAHDHFSPAVSPTSLSEAKDLMLMELRGTAYSVALGALPSPDYGPSFSPRGLGGFGDFSLSATAV
jgi:hypothetical protein